MPSAAFFLSTRQLVAPYFPPGISGLNSVSVSNYPRQTCHRASLKTSTYHARRNCAMEAKSGPLIWHTPLLALFSLLVLSLFSFRSSSLFFSCCIFSLFLFSEIYCCCWESPDHRPATELTYTLSSPLRAHRLYL